MENALSYQSALVEVLLIRSQNSNEGRFEEKVRQLHYIDFARTIIKCLPKELDKIRKQEVADHRHSSLISISSGKSFKASCSYFKTFRFFIKVAKNR
jgi:hypothetical protein